MRKRPSQKQRTFQSRERAALQTRPHQVWEQALASHRSGDVPRAKQLYELHLSSAPQDAAALHLLGFAEFQLSQFNRAIERIEAAIRLRPDVAEFHNNLALAYLANRQLTQARLHAETARRLGHDDGHGYWHVASEFILRRDWLHAEAATQLGLIVQPESPECHNCRGIVLAAQQRYAEAEASYRHALELNPVFVEALNNLGNVLRDQNRNELAIEFYRKAIEYAPSFAAAHNNLGIALANQGHVEQAIECYQQALRLQPQFAEALNNLGNAHRDLGNHESALECYRQSLKLQPGSPEVQSNLGVSLRRAGRLAEAVAYFRRAVVLQPGSVKIHHHLASSLAEGGQFREAAACLAHVARLEPQQPLWRLQTALLCPTVFFDREEMDAYRSQLQHAITQAACTDYSIDLAEVTNVLAAPPFNVQFYDGCVRAIKETYAALFDARFQAAYQSDRVAAWRGPQRLPRIGIVVTEGHEGIFLKSLQGVIERLRGFEVILFCGDQARIRAALARDHLSVVRLPPRFDLVVRRVDEAQCDLLYYWEVGTDNLNYFLPFLRLAPVQITSWGIQVTSGIPNLDYYLSSKLLEPSDAQAHYSERLVLANTLLTYRERAPRPAPQKRDRFPLPPSAHWYVCAQQFGKFHIDMDGTLAEILRRDPHGIVVVAGDKYRNSTTRLQQRFHRTMPDVVSRVHVLPRLDSESYFGLIQQADVLLDPPHFGGVNSTYDALSIGKPVVALPSPFHRGRYTLGCYRKMGIEECIAGDREDFVARAIRIAVDRDYRLDLEERLFTASEVLFADLSASREHERLFHELLNAARRKVS